MSTNGQPWHQGKGGEVSANHPFPGLLVPGDSLSLDAFNHFRVSEPGNRLDAEFIYDKQPLLFDEVTAGGGSADHQAASGDVVLSVGDADADSSAALYSYDVPYTPGCSQRFEITGTLDNAGIGGGSAVLFLRSKVTGTVVDDPRGRVEWSRSLDDLDFSTSQIFAGDFQSLKVGAIRFGFSRSGIPVAALKIGNDNKRATGYWRLPTLPVCYRIYNDSEGANTIAEICYGDEENAIGLRYTMAANANATLRAICCTVKSEGGPQLFDMPGFPFSHTHTAAKTVSSTLIPLLSIRPAATFNSIVNRSLVIPESVELVTNNQIRYVVLYRPTLTGASWTAKDATYSGVEYDVTASAVTGGIEVASGIVPASSGSATQRSANLLGRLIAKLGRTGTADIVTIAAIRTSTDAAVWPTISWREIR